MHLHHIFIVYKIFINVNKKIDTYTQCKKTKIALHFIQLTNILTVI